MLFISYYFKLQPSKSHDDDCNNNISNWTYTVERGRNSTALRAIEENTCGSVKYSNITITTESFTVDRAVHVS